MEHLCAHGAVFVIFAHFLFGFFSMSIVIINNVLSGMLDFFAHKMNTKTSIFHEKFIKSPYLLFWMAKSYIVTNIKGIQFNQAFQSRLKN